MQVDAVPQTLPEVTIQVLPDPAPLKLLPVVFGDAKVNGVGYLTLDGKNYANSSRNMTRLLRWIDEAMWRLNWYREELTKKAVDVGRPETDGIVGENP